MTDLKTMLKIFAGGEDDFQKVTGTGNNPTVTIVFPERKIRIYFDEKGKFECIVRD